MRNDAPEPGNDRRSSVRACSASARVWKSPTRTRQYGESNVTYARIFEKRLSTARFLP